MDMLERIKECALSGNWYMSHHAREQAGKRHILMDYIVHALCEGELIEDYPADPISHKALILGHTPEEKSLHAVCAFDPMGSLIIITVYEPTPPKWINERTRGGSK